MKNTFYLLLCSILLMGCKKEGKINSEVLSIPVEAKMERFDQEFMQVTPENFNALQNKYPYLLS